MERGRKLQRLMIVLLAVLAAFGGARAQETETAPELPRVQGIVVEGERRYTEAQIIGVLGQRVGQPFDPLALDKGLTRLYVSFSTSRR
ncbi:MAG: hypothetical protein NTV21_03570 [Planctomycetota bacterium]|nr:hypothetical protein [Planctomycetota bacterium]